MIPTKKTYSPLLSLALASLLFFPSAILAQGLTFNTYNISPKGNYEYLRLIPRDGITNLTAFDYWPGDSCPDLLGTIYNNQSFYLTSIFFCKDNAGTETWEAFSPHWSLDAPSAGGRIHVSLATPRLPAQLIDQKIGIGTKTPFFKLTIMNDAGIFSQGDLASGFQLANILNGVRFFWYPRKAAIAVGDFTNNALQDANIENFSTVFGQGETFASGDAATVYGTVRSQATALGATVGGGSENIASGQYATVAGGYQGQASGDFSFVGWHAAASGAHSVALLTNRPLANNLCTSAGAHSFVAGGQCQWVSGGNFSTQGGGQVQEQYGDYSSIGGGVWQIIHGHHSVALGGLQLVSSIHPTIPAQKADFASLGGGFTQGVHGLYGTIIGGSSNVSGRAANAGNPVNFRYGTIAGGWRNDATGDYSTVFGGRNNTASGKFTFVGGGRANQATGLASCVAGGETNRAIGDYSAVGGGQNNVVGDIAFPNDHTKGAYSTILGGNTVTIYGSFSFAAGQLIRNFANNSFVWGHFTGPARKIAWDNTFVLLSPHVGIGANDPAQGKLLVGGDIQIDNGSMQILNFDPMPDMYLQRNAGNLIVQTNMDVAEIFETQENVSIGDVVAVSQNKDFKLQRSRQAYDPKVIGVVSAAPAAILEGQKTILSPQPFSFKRGKKPPIALAGRVLVKVSLENGPIAAGDLLTSAKKAGYAMKASDKNKARHAIIGKALGSFSGRANGKSTGMIEIIVMNR